MRPWPKKGDVITILGDARSPQELVRARVVARHRDRIRTVDEDEIARQVSARAEGITWTHGLPGTKEANAMLAAKALR